MKKNRLIKIVLFCFGFLLLFVLIYRVGFSEVVKIISGANLYLAFLGALVYLAAIFIRSFKWFFLTRIIADKVNYRQFVPFYFINSLLGNLTPFKFGEAGTPFLFRKYLKIPVGRGFSVIILDRFFELIIFIVMLVLAVFYILNHGIENSLIFSVFKVALPVLLLLLAVFIIVLVYKKITLKIVRSFKILRFAEKELDIFYSVLPLFKNKKAYLFIIALTSTGWFFEFLSSYLIFSAVLSVSFINIAVAQAIAAVATFITFIPNGMGVSEVSMVYLLDLLHYPVAFTAGAAILARLFLDGVVVVAGLAGFLLLKKAEHSA